MTLTLRVSAVLTSTLLLATAAASGGEAPSGDPIQYTVSLPAPQTQMVEMSIRVPDVDAPTLDFSLPVWRPGRYTVLNPASTVRSLRAFDGEGHPLTIEKISKATWRVTTAGADTVRVDYRVYANSLRDRTRHVDDTHAFLSPSAVFLYAPTRRSDPLTVHVDAPEDWTIATGLEMYLNDPDTLLAPNYDVLVDSPLEIGVHDLIRFDVAGQPHEIAIWGDADYEPDELIADFTNIIETQTAIFGTTPYDRYVFLIHVGQGGRGATEHLNSTILQTSRRALEEKTDYRRFLGTVSHEFFHTWNVKQIRPTGIHPYDYQHENYTRLLWVSEGTTTYYSGLTLTRAGLLKPDSFLQRLSSSIGSFRDRPARSVQSLEESSFDAWIHRGNSNPDSVNSQVDFYSKGSLVSLLLDLELRRVTDNAVSLDAVMRTLYERFPLSGPGVSPRDLQNTIEDLSGTSFTTFFANNVQGAEPLEFELALPTVGLELYFKPAKKDDDDDDPDAEDDAGDSEADAENSGTEEDARETARVDVSDPARDDDGDDDATDAATDLETDDDPDSQPDPESEPEPEAEPEPDPITMKPYLGVSLSGTTVRSVRSDSPAYDAGLMPGDEIISIDGRRLSGSLDARLKRYEPGDLIHLTYFRRDELREMTLALTGKPDGAWTVRRLKNPTDDQMDAYESWLGQPWPNRPEPEPDAEPEVESDPPVAEASEEEDDDGEGDGEGVEGLRG